LNSIGNTHPKLATTLHNLHKDNIMTTLYSTA